MTKTRWCVIDGDSVDNPDEARKHQAEKHNGRTVAWDEFKPGSLDSLLRSAFRAGARYGRTNANVERNRLSELYEARAFHGWRSAMDLPDADESRPEVAMGSEPAPGLARAITNAGTTATPSGS